MAMAMPEEKKPLVSIIIPCYNYGQFLAEAIDSSLHQTYPSIEVIVVDDGSTDNTEQVAASFGDKIIYLKQGNQGVVAARNNGAAKAKGQYLCFLDADDWLGNDFVSALVTSLLKTTSEVAYAYSDMFLVRGTNQVLLKSKSYGLPKLMFINIVPLMCVITAEAFWQADGFKTDDSKGYSFEDWDLWLTMAEKGKKGLYVPGHPTFYRLHGAGRNITGEEHAKELISVMRKAHPKLYKSIVLRVTMELYRAWFIFDDRVVKHATSNGASQ